MAKIIKTGKKNPGEFWVNKKLTCQKCGCKFQLEETDKVKHVPDFRDGDYYEVNCPQCKNSVIFYPGGGGPS
ncbi:MAG: hypothetical protein G01um101419_590 [Parcubacteria group bacterium Gr01-1014_19]|nr:MAG: hypothetical protein G01um101419_590 [Parcubacteria group bacterium Gr01-1014_19]